MQESQPASFVDTNDNEIGLPEEQGRLMPICRICLEGEVGQRPEAGQLERFCRCKGTMALCHHDCLVTWVRQTAAKDCELCHGPFDVTKTVRPLLKWKIPFSGWISAIDTGFCCLCFSLALFLLAVQFFILMSEFSGSTPGAPFLTIHCQLITMLTLSTALFLEEFVTFALPLWRSLRKANTVFTVHPNKTPSTTDIPDEHPPPTSSRTV